MVSCRVQIKSIKPATLQGTGFIGSTSSVCYTQRIETISIVCVKIAFLTKQLTTLDSRFFLLYLIGRRFHIFFDLCFYGIFFFHPFLYCFFCLFFNLCFNSFFFFRPFLYHFF